MAYFYTTSMEVTICISITLQIEQIKIANWKYTQRKNVNFAKMLQNVLFTWGGFLGKRKWISQNCNRNSFFHIYWSSGVYKSHMIII